MIEPRKTGSKVRKRPTPPAPPPPRLIKEGKEYPTSKNRQQIKYESTKEVMNIFSIFKRKKKGLPKYKNPPPPPTPNPRTEPKNRREFMLPPHVVRFRIEEIESKLDYLMEELNKINKDI